MKYALAALLLLAFDVSANTIAIKQEVAKRLDAAGLLANERCQYWDLPTVVVVGCFGPERARYYREVMKVLSDPAKKVSVDLNPVNKYHPFIDSGHIEVQ